MHITPLKVAFLLLLGAIILWIAGYSQTDACPITYRTEIVQGASLAGFIEDGNKVKIAGGYYVCNPVLRDDIVIYRDAGNPDPIIKIAKGIAGDAFSVALSEGGTKIFINGTALKTTTGEVYNLNSDAYAMLSLYERDYNGIIPDKSLLILGNLPGGSRDSSRFGLISQNDLIGKVVKVTAAE
ncbi:MAG: signal peptidase I [bacterium]|nr:signal peptidase I [bacterium]